jgi:hypothetical protein
VARRQRPIAKKVKRRTKPLEFQWFSRVFFSAHPTTTKGARRSARSNGRQRFDEVEWLNL